MLFEKEETKKWLNLAIYGEHLIKGSESTTIIKKKRTKRKIFYKLRNLKDS
jgi:hypothetical protein